MAHANSAAATSKVGSALRNTLSNVMSGNAGKMESLSAKVGHVARASRKTSASGNGEQSSGPLLITSIRGTSTRAMQSSLQHKPQAFRLGRTPKLIFQHTHKWLPQRRRQRKHGALPQEGVPV
jgi:hypothetical protein